MPVVKLLCLWDRAAAMTESRQIASQAALPPFTPLRGDRLPADCQADRGGVRDFAARCRGISDPVDVACVLQDYGSPAASPQGRAATRPTPQNRGFTRGPS